MTDRPIAAFPFLTRCLADEQLMRLIGEDEDPLAFAVLYERHLGSAFRLALQICSRHAIAEEVVQEAFLALWRNRSQYDRRRGSVRGWLLWIVRNRAIDVLRQTIPHESLQQGDELIGELARAQEAADQQASRREDTRSMIAALELLPHEQSAVIALAYYGGYTHNEIAAMLDTPVGTVKGRMRLGLQKMAESFSAAA
jgi:RNA polymerase sigma-70 factor (ECF subfamily)